MRKSTKSYEEKFQEKQADKDAGLRRAKAVRKSGRARTTAARLAPKARAVARAGEVALVGFEKLSERFTALELKVWAYATREISDLAYRWRKIGLACGDLVGVSLAYSFALDTSPLEGLVLAGGTVVALVIGGDLGGELRLQAQGRAIAAQVAAGRIDPTDEVARECTAEGGPGWAKFAWFTAALIFGLAGLGIGVLRAGASGGTWVAAALAVLTVCITVAAGLTSWRHANLYADLLDSANRRRNAAWRQCRKLFKNRALGRFCAMVEKISVIQEIAWHEVAARYAFGDATGLAIRAGNPEAFRHGVATTEAEVPSALREDPTDATGFMPLTLWKVPHYMPASTLPPAPTVHANGNGSQR